MIVEELVAMLGFDLRGEDNLRRFQAGLDGATRGLTSFIRTAGTLAAAAGAAVGAGTAALAKSVVDVGAQFENLEVILTTIEGSSAKAQESLDWISDFAAKTPYDLTQVADAFVRLRAYGLDPTSGLLRSVGDASSAMGKDLMAGVEAVADAMTGENERLKEFGIRASVAGDQITYAWTQNGQELKRTVNKNAEEIQAALTDIFDAKFFGVMEERSKTFEGIVANIGDMWLRFQRMIADAGFFDWVKDQFKGLLDTFQKFATDGTLERVAREISDTLVAAGEELKRLFDGLTVDSIKDFVIGLIDATRNIVNFATNITRALGAMGDFVAKALGLENSLYGLAAIVGAIAFMFRPWIVAFGLLFFLLDDLVGFLDGKTSAIGYVLEGLQEMLSGMGLELDLSPEGIKEAIGVLSNLLQLVAESDAGKWAIIAGGVALLAGRLFGLAGALWILKVATFIEFVKAVSKLINALTGVKSFEDFVAALQSLNGFEWAAIGAGLIGLVQIVRKAVGAFRSLAQAMNKTRNVPAIPEGPGGNAKQTPKGPKPGGGGSGWSGIGQMLSGLFTGAGTVMVGAGVATQVAAQGELTVDDYNAAVEEHRQTVSTFNGFINGIGDWWNKLTAPAEVTAPRFDGTAMVNQSHQNTRAAQDLDLLSRMGPILARMEAVAGQPAQEAGIETAQQAIDNSTTNISNSVNAPVTVNVTQTPATPSAIGLAAGQSVQQAGQALTRDLAVTKYPGNRQK